MSRRTVGAALVAAVLAICARDASAQPPEKVEEMTRAAQLVFRGTVQKVGASNLKAIEPAGDTAIVRIDEVLKAPVGLEDFTGREVTVKLRQPGSAKLGERGVFFTRSWLYGESLGLVEVGRAAGEAGALRSRIAAASQGEREAKIKEQLDRAALVVAGKVVETRPAAIQEEGFSEHDPQWWEAVIEVDSVLKGPPSSGKRVTVLFPTSTDVAWFEAPKLQVGWNAVWLLHKDQVPERADAYTVLKPWDLMSRDNEPIVRRLLQ
ncbi:MAG TPA: hypothetical protein VF756_11325 [Thermoanaerobaculia bacterium]